MTTNAHARRIRSAALGPPIRIDPVPTPSGGVRHLVHLEPPEARRYVAAVRPLVPAVEAASGSHAVANRGTLTRAGFVLEDWRRARLRFHAAARAGLRRSEAVFLGDVEDCYGSIRPTAVMSALRRLGVDTVTSRRVGHVLADMERRGVRGLPVGPDASAIVSNAVLQTIDRAFAGEGMRFLRWVDDVVVFAPDRATARRAHDVFGRTLASLGLRANGAKTTITDPDGARRRLIGPSISLASGVGRGMIRPP